MGSYTSQAQTVAADELRFLIVYDAYAIMIYRAPVQTHERIAGASNQPQGIVLATCNNSRPQYTPKKVSWACMKI